MSTPAATSPVAVVAAAGAATSIGLSAAEITGNIEAGRACVKMVCALNRRYDEFVLGVVPDSAIEPLPPEIRGTYFTTRKERMLNLARHALEDCLAGVNLPAPPPLFLALPETQHSVRRKAPPFLETFHAWVGPRFDLARSRAEWTGRAGGALAVGEAVREVQSGNADFVLAGGVDSYFDLKLLAELDFQKRTQGETHPDGFVPAEGAAFVLVTTPAAAKRAGLTTSHKIFPAAKGFEVGHLASKETYSGEGLSEAIRDFFKENPIAEPIAEVYASMNGERHWAKEWGTANMRYRSKLENAKLNLPAEFFGDVGAAFAPVATAVAIQRLKNGFCNAPVLLYGSSDLGDRAVFALTTF